MEKRNKGKIAVLILVILLLLAVAGVAVWYLAGKDNRSPADEDLAIETSQQEKEEPPKAEDITVEPTAAPEKDYGEIVDSYIEKEEYEQALKTLEEAYQETGNPEYETKIQELKEKQVLVRKKSMRYYGGGNTATCEEYFYNSKGEVTEARFYNDDGYTQDMESKEIYVREEVDGKVRCTISYLDGEGRLYQREVRDEEEKLLSIVSMHTGSEIEAYRFEYEYDEAGNLSVMKERYGENAKEYITWYENTYDEAGNLQKSVGRDADGKVWDYTIYDEQGRVIEELCHEGDDWYTITRIYEEDGSMTEVVNMGEEETLSGDYANVKTYDARGNMLTWHIKEYAGFELYNDEPYETYEKYVYDENDRLLEYTFTNKVSGWETKEVNSYSMEDDVLITETVHYTNGEITDHSIVHRMDEKTDRKTYTKIWDEENQELIHEEIREYDERGNCIRWWYKQFKFNGESELITIYEYGFAK